MWTKSFFSLKVVQNNFKNSSITNSRSPIPMIFLLGIEKSNLFVRIATFLEYTILCSLCPGSFLCSDFVQYKKVVKRNRSNYFLITHSAPKNTISMGAWSLLDNTHKIGGWVDILFPSNHNIHKNSVGLWFWASNPLTVRFSVKSIN